MIGTGRSIAPVWHTGRGPLGFLPAPLFRDDRVCPAILVGWLLTAIGSFAIGFAISYVAPDGAGPDLGGAPPLVLFLGLTLFSPITETIIMAVVLAALLRWLRPWIAVVVSAAGWGAAHSLMSIWWGVVIWWPFLIFSTVFVTWRAKGFWRAAAIACAIHICQNTVPAIAIVAGH